MSSIGDRPYWREIAAIAQEGIKPVTYKWQCTIHADGKSYVPQSVLEIDFVGDFIKNYAEEIAINVLIGEGTLESFIKPYKEKLEITIQKVRLMENQSPQLDQNAPIESYRFRATLYDNNSKTLESGKPTVGNTQLADLASLIPVRFQLQNPIIEQLRFKTWGGIIRNTAGILAVRTILTKFMETFVKDNTYEVKGVTMAPNYNDNVRVHIPVPHLTPVLDVPDVIDGICGGLYPAGFHYYLQNNYWFLYSPFNLKAYQAARKTLTIIVVEKNRLPEPERSYRETPTQLFVLATGSARHIDVSEQLQLNLGNGTRFMNANSVMELTTVEGNKSVADRGKNVSEIVVDKRETGLDYIKESDVRITSNVMTEYAKLAMRSGGNFQVVWENSDRNLIYPGMPLKVIYLEDGQTKEVYGVLNLIHTHTAPNNRDIRNPRFVSISTLTLFIERIKRVSV